MIILSPQWSWDDGGCPNSDPPGMWLQLDRLKSRKVGLLSGVVSPQVHGGRTLPRALTEPSTHQEARDNDYLLSLNPLFFFAKARQYRAGAQ